MRCFECRDKTETYPWTRGCAEIELCEYCHPKCAFPGCKELMMRGGEYGGCVRHEAMSDEDFLRLIRSAEMSTR